jgi:hypothetical protein
VKSGQKEFQKKFVEIWSRETIDPLVKYPEKTDRLEAAAAAGKPGPLVLFLKPGSVGLRSPQILDLAL